MLDCRLSGRGFETWPGSLCCVFGEDPLLLLCFSLLRCSKWVLASSHFCLISSKICFSGTYSKCPLQANDFLHSLYLSAQQCVTCTVFTVWYYWHPYTRQVAELLDWQLKNIIPQTTLKNALRARELQGLFKLISLWYLGEFWNIIHGVFPKYPLKPCYLLYKIIIHSGVCPKYMYPLKLCYVLLIQNHC